MCFHLNWNQHSIRVKCFHYLLSIWVKCFHYLLDFYQILWKNLNSNFHLQKQNFGLCFLFQYYQYGFHLEYFLDDSLISGVMLESEFTFSFAIVKFITSEFWILKYESKSCTVGLLNIKFFVNKLFHNSFYEVSTFISSDHSSRNVPMYFVNITVFTFDVPNIINSRNNNWCKWRKLKSFIVLIVSFIITFLIRRNN